MVLLSMKKENLYMPLSKKPHVNQGFYIDSRRISSRDKPFIVAEMSANHNGSIEEAFKIIESAKACGADAIKLQTYEAHTITIDSDRDDFKIKKGLWCGENLYDLYKRAQTPFSWHKALFNKAREVGITIFSTPFDETAVELLESLNAPAYKIASFEAIDLPLIQCVAKTKKPVIISTGMANFEEIGEAVETARSAGCVDLILLHCVSGYPTPIAQTNLRTMQDLSVQFNVMVGLSDHTLGMTTSIAAVALGAVFIEKHFTLSRDNGSADAAFSLTPNELSSLCSQCEDTWLALGDVDYSQKECEKENAVFRRSIYAVQDIKQGELFTRDNIKCIRPGFGLKPKYYNSVIGREALTDIKCGMPLSEDFFRPIDILEVVK